MTDETDPETETEMDPSAEQGITEDEPGPGVEPVDENSADDETEEDSQQDRERRRAGGESVDSEDDA